MVWSFVVILGIVKVRPRGTKDSPSGTGAVEMCVERSFFGKPFFMLLLFFNLQCW
jgi:hypothetical protein